MTTFIREARLVFGVNSSFDFPTATIDVAEGGGFELSSHTGPAGQNSGMDINRRYVVAVSDDPETLIKKASGKHGRILITSRAETAMLKLGVDLDEIGMKSMDALNPDAIMANLQEAAVSGLRIGTLFRLQRSSQVFRVVERTDDSVYAQLAGSRVDEGEVPRLRVPNRTVVRVLEGDIRESDYKTDMQRIIRAFMRKGYSPQEAAEKAVGTKKTKKLGEKIALPKGFWHVHTSVVEGHLVSLARDRRTKDNHVAVFIDESMWKTGFSSQRQARKAAVSHLKEEHGGVQSYPLPGPFGYAEAPAKSFDQPVETAYLRVPVTSSIVTKVVMKARECGGRVSYPEHSPTYLGSDGKITNASSISFRFPDRASSRKFEAWYNEQEFEFGGDKMWVVGESQKNEINNGARTVGYAMSGAKDAQKIAGTSAPKYKARKVGKKGALSLIREIDELLGESSVDDAPNRNARLHIKSLKNKAPVEPTMPVIASFTPGTIGALLAEAMQKGSASNGVR